MMYYGCCNVCNLILDAFAALLLVGWLSMVYVFLWLLLSIIAERLYVWSVKSAMRRLERNEASE
jgi:hypothetical protein